MACGVGGEQFGLYRFKLGLACAEARMSALNNELNGLRAELETLAARGSQAAVEPAVIEAPIADVAAGEVTDEPSDAA